MVQSGKKRGSTGNTRIDAGQNTEKTKKCKNHIYKHRWSDFKYSISQRLSEGGEPRSNVHDRDEVETRNSFEF